MAVFCSSGTTGQQASRHFHCAESLALYQAASWAWFRTHLVPEIEGACAALAPKATTDSSSASAPPAALPAQPQPPQLVILTPPAVEAPQSSLVHMFETINGRLGGTARFCGAVDKDGSWSVALTRVEAVLEQALRAGRAVLLLGTAFSYVHCLDDWSTRGRRFALPSGSRVLETGGYKGRSRSLPKEELHRQLCASLGVPDEAIISEYGMSELTSQAYDGVIGTPHCRRGSSRLFRFPPWARAQVISPETGHEVAPGQTGLLRIVDLANVWSVLAVQTEDLAARHEDGFKFIGRAAQAEARGCSLMVR
jgi:hypothetical protein